MSVSFDDWMDRVSDPSSKWMLSIQTENTYSQVFFSSFFDAMEERKFFIGSMTNDPDIETAVIKVGDDSGCFMMWEISGGEVINIDADASKSPEGREAM